MDCLKSFSLVSSANGTFAAPEFTNWGAANNLFWNVKQTIGSSIFNVAGFKNINIYGIEVIGTFEGSSTLVSNGIVNDWNINLNIEGQAPLTNGNVTVAPNFLSLQDLPPFVTNFGLSKYSPKIKLSTPIQSVKNITFTNYNVNGYGAQNPLQIQLNWNLNFIIYYQFEGE
jgi:hypothetical protein